MKRGYDRARRVADLIQRSLAKILLQEMGDQRFQLVSVTGVTLSRDFAYAKVYVGVLSEEQQDIDEILAALNSVSRTIRFHLAKDVEMRVIPELRFIYDQSTAHGFRINDLIKKANKDNNEE